MPVFWKLLWAHMHNAAIYCGQWRGTYKLNGCLYRGFKADPLHITKVPETVPKSYVVWSPGSGRFRRVGVGGSGSNRLPRSPGIAFRAVPGAALDHGIYKQIQLDSGVRDRLDSVGRRSREPERSGGIPEGSPRGGSPRGPGFWPRTRFQQSNECDVCTRAHIFEGSVSQL